MLYKLALGSVGLSMLGRTNENPPWRHNGRSTDYHHLILVIAGQCALRVEGRRYQMERGGLAYIPAKKYYRLTTDDHCEYAFACFFVDSAIAEEEEGRRMLRTLPEPERRFYLPQIESDEICLSEFAQMEDAAYSNLLALFTHCQRLSASGRFLDRLMIESCFREMLIQAAEVMSGGAFETKYSLSLERMLKYIDQNFTERMTPELLGKRFSLSAEHICALFRREMGMTVSAYVNEVRLNHAVDLLSYSAMNISQIAEYLGYSSVYYFSRLFKRRYGVSPTSYFEKR